MKFLTAYCTDIGVKRPTNQDSLCVKTAQTSQGEIALAVVCDGMGGLQKGELASGSVIKAFSRWFDEKLESHVLNNEYESIEEEWEEIVQSLNSKIMSYGKNFGIQLGTTVTAMLFKTDGTYLICHVGDSRAYKITNELSTLTTDHTLVQRELSNGHITEEQAKVDKRRNILLQCIGASRVVVPEMIKGTYNKHETYVLCSDGFVHEIKDDELVRVFTPDRLKTEEDMVYYAKRMIGVNIDRGEKDNITLAIVRTE